MPNPKRKHSRARRDTRRAQNWKLELGASSKCPNCGVMRMPHRVCPACGFYRDRVAVPKKEKKEKAAAGQAQDQKKS
ncbi:MAG TPA: 50S ribosomal protein L32 [Elusimicrobiales bacterium]|nr:50S ribosomal protein L32 [Elusimicrobiales bacterium]